MYYRDLESSIFKGAENTTRRNNDLMKQARERLKANSDWNSKHKPKKKD